MKRKIIIILAGIVLSIGLVLAGIGIHASRIKAQRQRIVNQFLMEAAQMESLLRTAYMKPMHNIHLEKEMANARIKFLQEAVKSPGTSEPGTGHFAIGYGYFALHDYKKAKEYLELAWNKFSFQNTEIAYALGYTMAELYRLELEKIQQTERKYPQEQRLREAEKLFRDPALMYFRKSIGTNISTRAYVESIIAFNEKHYQEALAKADEVFHQDPRFYDTKKLEGDIYTELGDDNYNQGEYNKALEYYALARKAYKDAIDIASSDASLYDAECRLGISILHITSEKGVWQEEDFNNALHVCNNALKVDPQSAEAHLDKSLLYLAWGQQQLHNGEDPHQVLSQMIEIAQQAIKLNPHEEIAYLNIGIAYQSIGSYEAKQGNDPRPSFYKATEYFLQAGQSRPYYARAFYWTAITYDDIANYASARGMDPRASWSKAIDNYARTVWINPKDVNSYNSMTKAYVSIGEFQWAHGFDPSTAFDEAINNYNKILKLNPHSADAYNNRASVYVILGKLAAQHGIDPHTSVEQAINDRQKAIEINSHFTGAYLGIGEAYMVQAEYDIDKGKKPDDSFIQALDCLQKTQEISPDNNNVSWKFAQLYLLKAHDMLNQSKSPLDALDKSRNCIPKMMQTGSKDISILLMQGKIDLLAAQWAIHQKQSPLNLLEKAENSLKKARELDSKDSEIYQILADILRWRLEWYFSNKANKTEELQPLIKQALLYAGRSINNNPDNANAYFVEGALYEFLAQSATSPESQSDAKRQSDYCFNKAYSINPLLSSVWVRPPHSQ